MPDRLTRVALTALPFLILAVTAAPAGAEQPRPARSLNRTGFSSEGRCDCSPRIPSFPAYPEAVLSGGVQPSSPSTTT